ncbi:hypothetical protein [uncultured Massilia sp.]|uniref:hypothetical protein n=1 Tax=uncultured Massilia sp. TaxID=169973 RepID=UPI0025D9FB9D|nr:hypothetical protein [uncultured Massilia sp.]
MKKLAIIVSLAALGGCATTYPGPANYGSRAYAQAPDADGWQVVSVTPVPVGTGASSANGGVVTSSPVVGYSPAPVAYATQPVYVAPPVYAPAPVYVDPWYPPISIGLGFSWSNWGHGHRGGHYGGHYGGGPRWRGHR